MVRMSSSRYLYCSKFQNIFVCVIVHILSVLTSVNSYGFSYKYLDRDNKILKLKCDGSVNMDESAVTFISIYNVTSMKTLAYMRIGECPMASGFTGMIVYTMACVMGSRLPVLRIMFPDLEITSRQSFGCNITKSGKSVDTSYTTWTIVVDKIGHTPVASERAAESQLKPAENSVAVVDSYFPAYAMGFTILSLAIGLAAALFYIGINKLKATRSSARDSEMGRPGRHNENMDMYSEESSDSGNSPDVGGERSLMCPAAGFRRPSGYQEFSEPLSPTPSGLSDYVGIDFLQAQLSTTPPTGPSLKLQKQKLLVCGILNTKSRSEPIYQLTKENQIFTDITNDHYKVPSGTATVLVLEYTRPFGEKFHSGLISSWFNNHTSGADNWIRGTTSQRA